MTLQLLLSITRLKLGSPYLSTKLSQVKLQKIFAEFLGTALLLSAVIGSGIMATNLTQDVGIQLTINAISIVSMLYLIITLLGPISGAHFNPVVTLGELFKNRIDSKNAGAYIIAQFAGGFTGTVFVNLIFNKPAIFQSHHERTGTNLFISEIFATAGLIMIIHLLVDQKRTNLAPYIIPAWITTAFYATSSFVFANPAVTFARIWSDSFAGITFHSAWIYMIAQLIGLPIGLVFARILFIKK
jgi:glycerol uptake facilitator-like aquaporin